MTAAPETAVEPRLVSPVTRADFVRYAGAGGDFNPVHHDDEYARALGFPSVFAMGMWSAGLLGAFASDHLGVGALRGLDFRFRAPVWPGDELSCELDQGSDGEIALVLSGGGTSRVTGRAVTGRIEAADPAGDQPTSRRLDRIRATEFEAVEFPVERGKILEFSRAVRASSPVHYERAAAAAAGYADLVAPPTFTDCVTHWSGGDASEVPIVAGLDLRRVLHGEQRYRYHRPVVAGDVLTVRRTISDVRTKPARSGGEMTLVTLTSEFLDDTGASVVREEMLMIEQPVKGML